MYFYFEAIFVWWTNLAKDSEVSDSLSWLNNFHSHSRMFKTSNQSWPNAVHSDILVLLASFITFNCHVSLAPLQCVASKFPALGNLWLWWLLVNYFVECLSVWVCLMLSLYVFLAGLSCWWRYFQPLILSPADLANSSECSGVQIKIVMSSLLEFFLDRSCLCSIHPWVWT